MLRGMHRDRVADLGNGLGDYERAIGVWPGLIQGCLVRLFLVARFLPARMCESTATARMELCHANAAAGDLREIPDHSVALKVSPVRSCDRAALFDRRDGGRANSSADA